MIDPAARRLIVASVVRLHVAARLGSGVLGDDLVAAAERLRPTDDVERRHGLAFVPSYPGATAGIEAAVGGARLVLACRVTHRGEPAATVVTTLVVGRSSQVTAAPPEVPVPVGWSVL